MRGDLSTTDHNVFFNDLFVFGKEKRVHAFESFIARRPSLAIVGAIIVLVWLWFSGVALSLDTGALPTGGKITSGKGSISTMGSQMTVTQSTDKMIATWETFNIGKRAGVTFKQPDADSAALNRINDQNPSQILGNLSANGKVYLINPSGIVFGEGSQVNVGGLVASSLNITDSDFLTGNYTFLNNGNSGSILNQGDISVIPGSIVALIAPQVVNEGTLTANGGSVILGAGNQVSLDFNGDGLISYKVNKGAADALTENKGLIQADGGMVVMTAEAANNLSNAAVNNSGVIEAQTLQNKEGKILLMSDMDNGTTIVGGKLDASAPNGGDGGFIETSGQNVKVNDGTVITTAAPLGSTGTWLIDPTDFTIAAGSGALTTSGIGATTLETALAGTNTTIATSAAGAEDGDIHVNANVTWSANTLSLQAHGDINVNAILTANNTASLDMRAGYSTPGAEGGTFNGTNRVRMGFNEDGSFKGRVDFFQADGSTPRSGAGFLTINGNGYTVITELGLEGSMTGTDLQGINGNPSGYYALGSNIDASATSTWNGCLGFSPLKGFTGQFNGLGHTVNNIYINRPSENYVGIFGTIVNGQVHNVGIENCNIVGRNRVGGLVGYSMQSSISQSYATGSVSGNYYVGGLVGENYNSSTITQSYATGSVSGNDYVGGLVGDGNNQSTITQSYATGSVSGKYHVGGLVSHNYNSSTITQSYATGSVSGTFNYIGGLVGENSVGSTITQSYATGSVSGNGCVGGLVGYSVQSSISQSYATGSVNGLDFVGGLAGGNENASISQSYATGSVNGTGNYVGGLVGGNENASISQSYATGSVGGNYYIGGLAGENSVGSTITQSYTTGSVSGNSYVGGLVGVNSSTITQSYATGSVNGTGNYVGGLVGWNDATISDSFWDTITSGMTTGIGGGTHTGATGLTTAQMMTMSSFSDWDIANTGGTAATWRIYEGYTYPLLRSYLTPLVVTADDVTKTYDANTGILSNVSYSDPNAPTSGHLFNMSTPYGAGGGRNAGSYNPALYSDQQGYDISYVGGTLTVNKAPLTVTAQTNTKTYDGTTSAAAIPVITSGSLQGTDTANFTETYDNKNAGTGKTLMASGTVNDGNSGNNYSYTFIPDATGVISKAPLTVTAQTNTKTYDGTTSAAALPLITVGSLQGTDTANFIETYDNKNVGTGKTLTASGTVNDGNGGNNYSYTFIPDATGVINKAPLTVTATAVKNTKIYDGTTAAAAIPINGQITSGQLYGTDTINYIETYDNKNVGKGKTLTAGAIINDGNGGNNYDVTMNSIDNSKGKIKKAKLYLIAQPNTKTYDGTTTADAEPVVVGLQGTDTVTDLTEVYTNPDIGIGKTLVVESYIVNDDNNGLNYKVKKVKNKLGVITAP